MLSISILVATIVVAVILLLPRIANATLWRATTTPLASIIGSGFLILGPILSEHYGGYAPLVMAALCLCAYLFGGSSRYNIAAIKAASGEDRRPGLEVHLETAASWTLSFAYVISVAYYLNLFGEFAVSLTPFDQKFYAECVTSAVFVVILGVGLTKGFKALERMEQISVGIKLAIIAGLLVGLGVYFSDHVQAGELVHATPTVDGWWGAITLGFGLIVTVQGFETSRYLKEEYDARTRIRSMHLAQWLSTGIYMAYIVFMAYVFEPSEIEMTETAIIDMMAVVAPILPGLLVAAALSAQFSAAVADTSGSGGLVAELTRNRIKPQPAYALLCGIGLLLTWAVDLFEIISYASRAFAAYYAVQSLIAAATAWHADKRGHKLLAAGFLLLAILGAVIVIFGRPVE